MGINSYAAYRAAAEQPDYDYEGPDIRVLWNKTHKARRAHLCDCCNEAIDPGATYESRGWIEDGDFKSEKIHLWAWNYPSGCPRLGERDKAELAAQFEAEAMTPTLLAARGLER